MPNSEYKIFENIPHYYGDFVRLLFVATAALSFLAIPIWGQILPYGIVFEVIAGIVLVVLAGLTNPHSKWVMYWNILVSGLGAFLLEITAISLQPSSATMLLAIREVSVLLLITALYFSIKTARAMSQGKIGELPRPWEFEDSNKTQ